MGCWVGPALSLESPSWPGCSDQAHCVARLLVPGLGALGFNEVTLETLGRPTDTFLKPVEKRRGMFEWLSHSVLQVLDYQPQSFITAQGQTISHVQAGPVGPSLQQC